MSSNPEAPRPAEPPPRPAAPDARHWPRIDAALDELLALPALERPAAMARLAGSDLHFAQVLQALLSQLDQPDERLDQPALMAWSGPEEAAAPDAVQAGTRFGAWRLGELLGRGGMGEVYRADRGDGQYQQQAAIKLMRADMAIHTARFQAERQIVARLDHPGIARLLDGGMASDGRPFMVMELVHGLPITTWCQAHGAGLERRLALFIQVCEAVAYAHRNLVVHRDIKPANVLVTEAGQPKLLDFGVARLLEGPAGEASRELLVTPGYASPEQLSGGPITTTTDVYALGLLLYELLVDQAAFPVQQLPLAAAMQQVITQPAPMPSRAALQRAEPPVAAPQLEGDLDAIVAKALRKEPAARYASVDELCADVRRHLGHQPVVARRGNWTYVASRALRRHRAWAVAAGVALVAVLGGSAATAWQASVARDEAARATAVKDFLLQVFRASDPRIASDKPRGQVTARELLDAASARIGHDFAAQPDLLVEMLNVLGSIYRDLNEDARAAAMQDRLLEVIHHHPGHYEAIEIEVLLSRADDLLMVPDRPHARELLQRVDGMIHRAGLEDSVQRAAWWTESARAEEPDRIETRQHDYDKALALFERVAPHDPAKVTVLTQMGHLHAMQQQYEPAAQRYRQAVAAAASTSEVVDGEMANVWGSLGAAEFNLGHADEAVVALRKAVEISQRTYGPKDRYSWSVHSKLAQILHMSGRRDEAMAIFEALRSVIPDPPNSSAATNALSLYAQRLVAQGEPARALAWLEADERYQASRPDVPFAWRLARWKLGEAYSEAGRTEDAGRMLKAAFDDYATNEPPASTNRLAVTERWARHLVGQGDTGQAAALFQSVLVADKDGQGAERLFAPAALAQAGLARVALAEGRLDAAYAASQAAVQRWRDVRGVRDVRMGAYIQRVQARVLWARGDREAARAAAAAALSDSERFDAPGAASITEARELIRLAVDARARP